METTNDNIDNTDLIRTNVLRLLKKRIDFIIDYRKDNEFVVNYFTIIKSLIKIKPKYIRGDKFYNLSRMKLEWSLYNKVPENIRLHSVLLAFSYMTEIEEVLISLEDYETLYNISRLNDVIKVDDIEWDGDVERLLTD